MQRQSPKLPIELGAATLAGGVGFDWQASAQHPLAQESGHATWGVCFTMVLPLRCVLYDMHACLPACLVMLGPCFLPYFVCACVFLGGGLGRAWRPLGRAGPVTTWLPLVGFVLMSLCVIAAPCASLMYTSVYSVSPGPGARVTAAAEHWRGGGTATPTSLVEVCNPADRPG